MKKDQKSNNKGEIEPDKLSKKKIRANKPNIRPSLLAKRVLIKGENVREFEEMRAKILEEVVPLTEIENILCEKIISAQWKINRLQKLESNHLSELNQYDESDDMLFGTNKKRRVRSLKMLPPDDPIGKELLKTQISLENKLCISLKILRKEQALRIKGSKAR